jgi:hypothetical protein
MKKLRMIVVTLAIVGGLYSFTEKKTGSLCVTYSGPNQSCAVVTNVRLATGPTNCWIQVGWNGDPLTCFNSANCSTPRRCLPD